MLHTTVKYLSIAISSALLLAACGQGTSSTQGDDFDSGSNNNNTTTDFNQVALITSLTDNVISPTFERFKTEAAKQTEAITAYCENEQTFANNTTDQTALDTAKNNARAQWRTTMNVWQQAEMMQLGPLFIDDNLLRDKIYSWPNVNTCGVDYDVVFFNGGTVNGQPYDITLRTASRKGLDALEYLLFNDNLASSCDTVPPIEWSSFTDTERKIARCSYATEVASDIVTNADTLLAQWNNTDGYAEQLKQAGTTGSIFTTDHEAVNRLSDALFYIDSFTKDEKLATPVGLLANSCGTSVCPEDVESPYSQHSLANIQNNLIAFEKLFTGESGVGFSDYLIDVGDTITATEMQTDITNVLTTISNIDTTLSATLEDTPEQVEQIHSEVKEITDKLKADFITSLALELPATSAGDND